MVISKSCIKVYVSFIAFFALQIQVTGQINRYFSFAKITQKDGITSINIRKIIQDKFGFIWFASQEGLSRFDGKRFLNYQHHDANPFHSLLNSDVADISFSQDSTYLFAITPYGGISIIDIVTGNVIGSQPLNKLPNGEKITITKAIARGDFLYIGTDEGYFLKYDFVKKSIVNKIFFQSSQKLAYVISNYILYEDKIILFLSDGVVLQYTEDFELITMKSIGILKNYKKQFAVNKVETLDASKALLACNEGLYVFNLKTTELEYGSNKYNKVTQFFNRMNCNDFCLNESGIWILSNGNLYRYNQSDKVIERFFVSRDPDDVTWIETAKKIFQTGNSLLISSEPGIAYIKQIDGPFIPFYKSYLNDKVKIDLAYSLFALDKSNLLIAASDGIYKANQNNIQKLYTGDDVNFLAQLNKDYIIASHTNKTFLFDRNLNQINIATRYPELSILSNDLIISCVNIGDTLILLASDNANGIYFWYPHLKKVRLINTASKQLSLKSNILNRLYLTKANEVLILCDDQLSIYNIRNNFIKDINLIDPSSHTNMNIIMDVCELKNEYWLAVYGLGIVELDSNFNVKTIFSTSKGLNSKGVYKILPYQNNILLISSNDGIVLLNTETGLIKTFYEEDGLNSNEFEEYSAEKDNGKMFFGGKFGYTIIDPSRFLVNKKPPNFYFTNIEIITSDKKKVDTSNIKMQGLSISKYRITTTVYFTAINYSNPQKVKYSYRLKENDTNWIDNGNQNFISLIGLSPGTYNLEVKAANEDEYWSTPKAITLIFEPKWYQTWWFYSAIAFAVCGLLYAFYRYRITQIKVQEEKVRQVREEIASDLHDDIGGTLNSIKIFAHLAEESTDKKKYFTQIKSSLKQASEGLRDMIWVLDDKNDTVEELIKRLDGFLRPVAEASNINIEFNIEATSGILLHKTEKRNLLMIVKEAISNCIKYADCKNIKVLFKKTDNLKKLIVHDDGKGFSEDAVTLGNGLKNIKNRAKQINYSVEINSTSITGTKITLTSNYNV